MNTKTPEELRFETYLCAHGRDDFRYEQPLPGTSKVPDYQLPASPLPLLFEVKGFDVDVATGFGYFNPYKPILGKIHKAKEKFKDLEAYSCSLVVQYGGPGLVMLDTQIIFGAMLGKIGFEIPFDRAAGVLQPEEARPVFTTGGKMLKYEKGGGFREPQNTTINAIVVLEDYQLGRRRFSRYCDELEQELGRKLTLEELWAEIRLARGTDRDVSLSVTRAVVHENPYARIPLDRTLFTGPCDERYGCEEDGRVVRLHVGDTAAAFDTPAI